MKSLLIEAYPELQGTPHGTLILGVLIPASLLELGQAFLYDVSSVPKEDRRC